MRQTLFHYVIVFGVFLAIDALWLSNAARWFYRPEIGQLLREHPDFVVAFVFYAMYAAGLLYFVVTPSVAANDVGMALMRGAFFGLIAYATYDMTNLATMKGFTLRIAVIDMIWGTVLSASVSAVSVYLIRLLKI
jgi:uncharacterized membrane protein